MVARVLEKDPFAKSEDVGRQIGKSASRVRNTTAWKALQGWQRDWSDREGDDAIQLTRKMLATYPGTSETPAEIAAERETEGEQRFEDAERKGEAIDERVFLERASPPEKAEYFASKNRPPCKVGSLGSRARRARGSADEPA